MKPDDSSIYKKEYLFFYVEILMKMYKPMYNRPKSFLLLYLHCVRRNRKYSIVLLLLFVSELY